jgi:hypothetical protein
VDVTVDGILPCFILGVHTVLAIDIFTLVIGNTEWIVCLAGYIALAEPALYLGLGDADVRQYTALLY